MNCATHFFLLRVSMCYTYSLYLLNQIFQYLFKLSGSIEKNLMSTCPVLNLVQSIFSCLSALANPDVYLSWAKFSSSLVDIKFCHNQWKLVSVSQRRYFRSHITIPVFSIYKSEERLLRYNKTTFCFTKSYLVKMEMNLSLFVSLVCY